MVKSETSKVPRAVCNCSSCGFVNDLENIETGNGISILGGLSLGIIEIGRNGNDRIGDSTAEVSLSCSLHLQKNHQKDLFGGLT